MSVKNVDVAVLEEDNDPRLNWIEKSKLARLRTDVKKAKHKETIGRQHRRNKKEYA